MRKVHDLVVVETVPGIHVPIGTKKMVDRCYARWVKLRGLTDDQLSLLSDVPFRYGKGTGRRGRPRKNITD